MVEKSKMKRNERSNQRERERKKNGKRTLVLLHFKSEQKKNNRM